MSIVCARKKVYRNNLKFYIFVCMYVLYIYINVYTHTDRDTHTDTDIKSGREEKFGLLGQAGTEGTR